MLVNKLKRLEENLKILNKIKDNYKLDNFLTDKVDEWGLRYGIFETIQIIIDIASSIVAEKNLGTPKSYSETINILVMNNFIDKNLGEKLISMIGLRNLIVHEYGIIDIKKLYEYLNSLGDIRDFVNSIKRVIT